VLVEIWSDVVCPWCAVGRARFEQALTTFERADLVDVRWRSFELDPNRQGSLEGDYVTMLARKYRTDRRQAQDMVDRMTEAGAEEGVEFRFDIARPGNTFDAHRLLHLAADRGLQHEAKARFLEGYHSQGVPIAEPGPLTELAVDAGLDRDEVTEVLAGDAYAADVRADEEQARDYGISGVPFFVFDRTAAVAGAQPAEHLLAALRQVMDVDDSDTAGTARAPGTRDGSTDHDGHAHGPGEACVDGVCTA
jgi:predicted DsbA family dithiol-disulfide isomerase